MRWSLLLSDILVAVVLVVVVQARRLKKSKLSLRRVLYVERSADSAGGCTIICTLTGPLMIRSKQEAVTLLRQLEQHVPNVKRTAVTFMWSVMDHSSLVSFRHGVTPKLRPNITSQQY